MAKEIQANFSIEEPKKIEATFEISARGGGTKDHDKLDNRDIPDQHPISAITNLTEALEAKQDTLTESQQDAVDSGITSTKVGNYDNHLSNTNNPHSVTKSQVGLGNVDNTSDLNKPISTATQTALDGKVPTTRKINNKALSSDITLTSSDIGALPDSTKYGASLSLTINSSTYVMTAQLKDQDGNNLGSSQTIDLPLESVVVGGSYDSETKKVILTLQNGSTIEFSVADLVSGLQTEITSNNKLSADLVDDSSTTNKFVTSTEKNTWNAKIDLTSLSIDSGSTNYLEYSNANGKFGAKVDTTVTANSTNLVTSGAVSTAIDNISYVLKIVEW